MVVFNDYYSRKSMHDKVQDKVSTIFDPHYLCVVEDVPRQIPRLNSLHDLTKHSAGGKSPKTSITYKQIVIKLSRLLKSRNSKEPKMKSISHANHQLTMHHVPGNWDPLQL